MGKLIIDPEPRMSLEDRVAALERKFDRQANSGAYYKRILDEKIMHHEGYFDEIQRQLKSIEERIYHMENDY